MSAYTTQARIEAVLRRPLTSLEAEVVEDVIESVSDQINAYTGRKWYDLEVESGTEGFVEPEEETRLFDSYGSKEIDIDACKDVSKIELLDSQGSVLLTLTDEDLAEYITYPLNGDLVESIFLRNYCSSHGPARVRITAVFGDGNVPVLVINTTTALASAEISGQSIDATLGGKSQESIEGYSYKVKTEGERSTEKTSFLSRLDSYKVYSLI